MGSSFSTEAPEAPKITLGEEKPLHKDSILGERVIAHFGSIEKCVVE